MIYEGLDAMRRDDERSMETSQFAWKTWVITMLRRGSYSKVSEVRHGIKLHRPTALVSSSKLTSPLA